MDIEGIGIVGGEGRLTDSQLEKATGLIESLPEETFLSLEEGDRKDVDKPKYMEIEELHIKYFPGAGVIQIIGKERDSKKAIGLASLPKEASAVVASACSVYFDWNNSRYGVHFK